MKISRVLTLCVVAITPPGCVEEPSDAEPLRFDSLEIGQRSRFRMLTGRQYPSQTQSPFDYENAVLAVEIVDVDTTGFRVRESFEAGSIVPAKLFMQLEPDATHEYYLTARNETLKVNFASESMRSRLFPELFGVTLPLADVIGLETEVFGWKTRLPYCECRTEAFIANGEINGTTYPRLNVIVENENLQVDGPGNTYIFHAAEGLVRSTHYSWWTGDGHGFDLISD